MNSDETSLTPLIQRAIRNIDRAAGSSPDTAEGREILAQHLGVARHALTRALTTAQTLSLPSQLDAIVRYFDMHERFLDADDAALQVVHQIAPLPLSEDRISLKDIQSPRMPKQVIEIIIDTINDGYAGDFRWMQSGGFNYHSGLNYCQIESGQRQPEEALRITSAGAVLMRERWTEKAGYPLNRFRHMLEATLAFFSRAAKHYKLETENIAIQSTFLHARNIKIGIVGDVETSFGEASFPMVDTFHIPSAPLRRASTELIAPKELASLLAADLRAKFKQRSIKEV